MLCNHNCATITFIDYSSAIVNKTRLRSVSVADVTKIKQNHEFAHHKNTMVRKNQTMVL